MTTNKDPNLKLRYSQGLGDVIACFLHSKPIGWLTKLITGDDKPCNQCSIRRRAWNTIFPIPIWKLFFKDQDIFLDSLSKDYKDNGYEIEINDKNKSISVFKNEVENQLNENDNSNLEEEFEDYNFENYKSDIEGYELTNISDNYLGEYLIRTQYFKKK